MNSIESFIAVTFILLILSMITEKATNLVKVRWPDLFKTGDDEVDEKRIMWLSIRMGIVVALLAKANIFVLYQDDFELGWSLKDWEKGWVHILWNAFGSFITGWFLSLGSKFFHDLLDLLLQTKNLKRKIVNRENWRFNDIQDVDRYIEENEFKTIDTQLTKFFKDFPEVVDHHYDGEHVHVTLRTQVHEVPNRIPVTLKSGPMLLLPVSFQFGD